MSFITFTLIDCPQSPQVGGSLYIDEEIMKCNQTLKVRPACVFTTLSVILKKCFPSGKCQSENKFGIPTELSQNRVHKV